MIFEGSILNRMDAMTIAEEIAPLFKTKITDKFGNQARYVSVHTIDFSKKAFDELIEYELNIHILSDQGQIWQTVIIREYADESLFESELARYRELVNRCLQFPDIDPNPLVKVEKERNLLILEKMDGFELKKFSLSENIRNFIFGRIYGALHGSKVERLDDIKMREFMEFLLQHLPFTDEEKLSISEMLESHMLRFSQNYGGFDSQIFLKPKNILFQVDPSVKQLDKDMIKSGDFIHASLMCESPDDLTKDRMRDIAFYFHKKAFNEFIRFGALKNTTRELQDFLDGYESSLELLGLPPLREMYISGITLNVQLIFVCWLFESEKIQIGEFDPHDDRDLLRYTYFLLTERPFEKLF